MGRRNQAQIDQLLCGNTRERKAVDRYLFAEYEANERPSAASRSAAAQLRSQLSEQAQRLLDEADTCARCSRANCTRRCF